MSSESTRAGRGTARGRVEAGGCPTWLAWWEGEDAHTMRYWQVPVAILAKRGCCLGVTVSLHTLRACEDQAHRAGAERCAWLSASSSASRCSGDRPLPVDHSRSNQLSISHARSG